MYSESIRTTRLHQAVREALRGMRRPAALASIGLATGVGATAMPALALDGGAPAVSVGHHAQQRADALLVLDPGVEDAETLLRDLPPGIRVERLPSNVAPLRGLEMLLQAHPGTRELHVVSHGGPGRLEFAGGAVDSDTLAGSSDRLSTWFDGVERPEIILYGCDVAASEQGLAFIDALARHTRAQIFASDDPTGSPAEGGDWTLERSTALAARAPLFGAAARAEFQGLLATFTVTDAGDSGPGTLRQAVIDANTAAGADVVEFDAALSGSTITLTSGEIGITDDLSINGLGAGVQTIDADDNSQIFVISDAASTVSVSGLTLTGGYAYGGNGGAIESFATSRLTISDSVITGNRAEPGYTITDRPDADRGFYYGGGSGGGVAQIEGELVITGTTIENNQAKYDGGGVWFASDNGSDLLQISESTITGNVAGPSSIIITGDRGGFGYGRGSGGGVHIEVYNYGGTFTVTDSSITSNEARQGGGLALYADALSTVSYGGDLDRGTLTISNTTVQSNTASRAGGGLFLYGEQDISDITIDGSAILDNLVQSAGPPPQRGGGAYSLGGGVLFANDYGIGGMTINDTTISGNTALLGGGVAVVFESYGSPIRIEASTISGNTAGGGIIPLGGGYASGFGGGIALFNEEYIGSGPYGSLDIVDSTISGNFANQGGGGMAAFTRQAIFGGPNRRGAPGERAMRTGGRDGIEQRGPDARGGLSVPLSEVRITGTTFSGNDAGFGGGIAAAATSSRGFSLTNSTISGNTANFNGGGIDVYAISSIIVVRGPAPALEIEANLVTIADNSTAPLRGVGSNIGGVGLNSGARLRLSNSVVADNGYDIGGTVYADFSLIGNDETATIVGANNLVDTDPLLEPLADNGGATETHLLGSGSPASDAGDPAFTSPPDFDQRGIGFPRIGNGRVDMGSTEGVPPNIAITPDPLNFGVVKVGEASPVESVTISNTGGPLDVSAVSAASGAFAAAGGTCDPVPFTLLDGEDCTLDFTFTPVATGADSLGITLTTNDSDGPNDFTLTGTGALGQLSITPDPADFGSVEIDTVSAPSSITLENIGAVEVDVDAIDAATAPFAAVGGTCGATPFSLAPTATCTLDYTFAPVALGPFSQTLDVTSDGTTSPDAFELTGTGTGGVTIGLSTNDLDFGVVSLGVGGSALVTLTNTGSGTLEITDITDPGAPFSLTFGARGTGLCGTPPLNLAPSASCDVQVGFDPMATGIYTASFDVLSNAPSSPDTVNLRGNADAPVIIPTLSRWGLVLLGGLMGLLGWFGFRRRDSGSIG